MQHDNTLQNEKIQIELHGTKNEYCVYKIQFEGNKNTFKRLKVFALSKIGGYIMIPLRIAVGG